MADKNATVGNPDFDWNSIGRKITITHQQSVQL